MNEKKFLKAVEVEGKTKFKLEEIIEISKKVIEGFSDEYELDTESVVYNKSFYITEEPVWCVDTIPILNKKFWPDEYETLIISDITGKAICIINSHGVAHEIKK
ncbi:hypothetical protein NNC19_13375 [Clostridium sp. SHJSY1]|uniref:hypothetical protein n=1 Tax=Clostridium sp. SHJSY1 TaxID=2942483 RepID=UPI002876394A|nr:hypothetical protein [Clostridium sp. SHJSY1]MDS0526677.1 hypothetical protein [Clostridium sp. SHJSY1]